MKNLTEQPVQIMSLERSNNFGKATFLNADKTGLIDRSCMLRRCRRGMIQLGRRRRRCLAYRSTTRGSLYTCVRGDWLPESLFIVAQVPVSRSDLQLFLSLLLWAVKNLLRKHTC